MNPELPVMSIRFAVICLISTGIALAQTPPMTLDPPISIARQVAGAAFADSWPKLDNRSLDDRRLALQFLARCRERIDQLQALPNDNIIGDYRTLILQISQAGGYVNSLLQDVVNQMALTQIGAALVHHPERFEEMERLLALLPPDTMETAGIGRIVGEYFGDVSREAEFNRWPADSAFLSKVSTMFGRDMREMRFVSDRSTSKLINHPSPQMLIDRVATTQFMQAYLLPGAISYLKHGGKWADLDARDVRPFLALMHQDENRFQFALFGHRSLGAGVLLVFRDTFSSAERASLGLNTILDDEKTGQPAPDFSHTFPGAACVIEGDPTSDPFAANRFVKGCRDNIDRLNTVPNEKTLEVYRALITKLEKTPGYLGAILQDVVYRVALSHIGGAIVRHPEQSSEMERLLAMLPANPWQTAGIEQILAESLGNSTFQTQPQDSRFLSRLDNLLMPKGPEGSFYLQAGTSQLIDSVKSKRQDIRGLLYRFAQTSWMRNYALPGALSYVKHGGTWIELDGRNPPARLSEIMGKGTSRFNFPMLGINAFAGGDLIYLRDTFTPDTRGSNFLLTAFANYE